MGIAASLVLARMLSSFLYRVTTVDPTTYLAVCALLIVIAVMAGFVRARRAAHVDPLTALRTD